MADLISSNDEQQEMAKQVEAIAEAAAQHDSQIAQMLNLVPKAAALSTAASRAINFTKKTWVDDPTSGTPITAADMNRLEQAIVDLNTTLTSVQNSLSQKVSIDKNSVHNAILSRADTIGQYIRLSAYDINNENGKMLIISDIGIQLFDVTTQTREHLARWDD